MKKRLKQPKGRSFFQNNEEATRFHTRKSGAHSSSQPRQNHSDIDELTVHGEYLVARYLPDTLREEFLNVAVLLVCPEIDYAHIKIATDFTRVGLFPDSDIPFLAEALRNLAGRWLMEGFEDIHKFRTYYANNIQLSPVYSVATSAPESTLQQLFQTFVETAP